MENDQIPETPSTNNNTPPTPFSPNTPPAPATPDATPSTPNPAPSSPNIPPAPASPVFSQPITSSNQVYPPQPSSIPKNAQITNQKSKKSFLIPLLIIAAISAIIVCLIVLKPFGSHAKTIAEFEQIMTNIGYSKAGNSSMSYSDSDGSFVTYTKGSGNTVDGLAMFYEMSSRAKLQQIVESGLKDSEAYSLLEGFDWSKEYNQTGTCSSTKPYICFNIAQRDNTLLIVMYHSDSLDKAKSESEAVVANLGY